MDTGWRFTPGWCVFAPGEANMDQQRPGTDPGIILVGEHWGAGWTVIFGAIGDPLPRQAGINPAAATGK